MPARWPASTGNRPRRLVPDRRFRTVRPGQISFREGVCLQEYFLSRRLLAGEDFLILLEHPPIVTLGRRSAKEHLLLSAQELARRGIDIAEAGRGGDVTYHGPGQLVGYPIVDLEPLGRDLHLFLRMLEAVLLETLAGFGIAGVRCPGKTGVWVGEEKVASIGIGVRRWVTWHGFALNVSTDISGFSAIVPCGLPGLSMTSLERLLGCTVSLVEVEERVINAFARIFTSRHAGPYEVPR
jgi:lipoyl(octanoyl) transferase